MGHHEVVTSNEMKKKKKKKKKKKDNKQCLLDTPRRVMVNKENYYLEYKGSKNWLSLRSSDFDKGIIFAMNLCAKYQKALI